MSDAVSEPEIGHSDASDGYRLHHRHWRPAGTPRGYVVALHGIQSHSGWYAASSAYLAAAGFDVRFLDRRGSGLNPGDRGHARHHDRLVNDVIQRLADVAHERDRTAPAAPLVLLAVSWGGKLAAVTCARRPDLVDGLALLYPGLCARVAPKWYQKPLLRLAARSKLARRPIRIPLDDPALFTSDPHWQQFIRDDPLALHTATAAFLHASVELDRLAGDVPERITCPTLLMLAGCDRIIDNAATRQWLARLGTPARTTHEYPAAAHTLEFEPDRPQVFADLRDWLATVPRGREVAG